MDDFLKTIKTTHWLLVLFSATTFLVGMMPSRLIDYWSALYDIEAIEQLNDMPLTALVSTYGKNELSSKDRSIHVHVTIKSDPEEFDKQFSYMESPKNTISRVLTAMNNGTPTLFEDATLSQIRRAFHYPIFVPFPYDERYAAVLECTRVRDERNFVLIEARFDEPVFDLPVPGSFELIGNIIRDDGSCYEFRYASYSLQELAWYMLESANSEIRKALADRFYRPDPPKSALGLTNQSIWQIVEHRTIAEAKRELQRLIKAREEHQSIIGLSINRDTALILLPAFILICFILMGSHVIAARDAFSIHQPVPHYPWIGWYREPSSQVITLLSLAGLPAASLAHLFKSGGTPWYVHTVLPLFFCVVGVTIWQMVRSLRAACDESSSNDKSAPT